MFNLRGGAATPYFLSLVAVASIAACDPTPALAHGILGQRFFPATITSDDPFAADELALPTVRYFDHETDYNVDYSKSILPGFAIGLGMGYIDISAPGQPSQRGFSNLDISPALEVYRDPNHEFILTTGLDWEVGGTGSQAVAERSSTYTPTIKFGKGFGNLPQTLKYLRPVAITGTVGYAIPGDGNKTIQWGGAVEYSLLYLQNNVHDQGLGNVAAHLTPIVEFSFSSPTKAGQGGTMGTINPGLLWSGQYVQLGAEAVVPVNRASGHGLGFVAQLHFYLDDIFPHSLGRPLFGDKK